MSDEIKEYYIGISAQAQEVDNINNDRNGAYSNINQIGSSLFTSYQHTSFGGSFTIPEYPTQKTVEKQTDIFSQMQNGSQATADAMLEVAKEIAKSNSISQTLVEATENAGRNNLMGLMQLVIELTVGNKHKGIGNKIQQIIGETQVLKNTEQMESMKFDKTPNVDVKDSQDNIVTPRVVRAKADAEKVLETQEMNSITTDELLDDLYEFFGGIKPDWVQDAQDSTEDFISDAGGFSEDFNPIKALYGLLSEDLEDEMNRLKESEVNNDN